MATECNLEEEKEELFLQIGIWANIFLSYKHNMRPEYIPKPFQNQMGTIYLWAAQVNKINVMPNMHVSDIGENQATNSVNGERRVRPQARYGCPIAPFQKIMLYFNKEF